MATMLLHLIQTPHLPQYDKLIRPNTNTKHLSAPHFRRPYYDDYKQYVTGSSLTLYIIIAVKMLSTKCIYIYRMGQNFTPPGTCLFKFRLLHKIVHSLILPNTTYKHSCWCSSYSTITQR